MVHKSSPTLHGLSELLLKLSVLIIGPLQCLCAYLKSKYLAAEKSLNFVFTFSPSLALVQVNILLLANHA
jgi:hypothetical protein